MTQIAELIRHLLDAYDKPSPAILEIPSKDHPYDPSKDGILRRARVGKFKILLMGYFDHKNFVTFNFVTFYSWVVF